MPSKSKAQAKLFEAAKHDPELAHKLRMTKKEIVEWVAADHAQGTSKLPEHVANKEEHTEK